GRGPEVVDHALPPTERGLALEYLLLEVERDDVGQGRIEPDRAQMAVEDQWPALAGHRRSGGDVGDVRGQEVAGCHLPALGPNVRMQLGRMKVRRRDESPRAGGGVRPDR